MKSDSNRAGPMTSQINTSDSLRGVRYEIRGQLAQRAHVLLVGAERGESRELRLDREPGRDHVDRAGAAQQSRDAALVLDRELGIR